MTAMRLRDAAVAMCVACALASCSLIEEQVPGTLAVRSARVDDAIGNPTLELGLDCALSGPMRDALDHGIALTLEVDLRAGSRWAPLAEVKRRVELRYFPLSRRYQLSELESGDRRSFATPAYLLAGLGALRLELPPAFAHLPSATALVVSARLDPAALPGALRLPALFEPAWRLATPEHAWELAR